VYNDQVGLANAVSDYCDYLVFLCLIREMQFLTEEMTSQCV